MCALFHCLSSNMDLPILKCPLIPLTKAILGKICNKRNILKICIPRVRNLKQVIHDYYQSFLLPNQSF